MTTVISCNDSALSQEVSQCSHFKVLEFKITILYRNGFYAYEAKIKISQGQEITSAVYEGTKNEVDALLGSVCKALKREIKEDTGLCEDIINLARNDLLAFVEGLLDN